LLISIISWIVNIFVSGDGTFIIKRANKDDGRGPRR